MNAIELKEVTKTFGNIRVLDKLSLEIPKGKITLIYGESGSGRLQS